MNISSTLIQHVNDPQEALNAHGASCTDLTGSGKPVLDISKGQRHVAFSPASIVQIIYGTAVCLEAFPFPV